MAGEEGGERNKGGPGAPSDAGDALVAATWGPLRTSASSLVFSPALIPVRQAQESIFPACAPTHRSMERCLSDHCLFWNSKKWETTTRLTMGNDPINEENINTDTV